MTPEDESPTEVRQDIARLRVAIEFAVKRLQDMEERRAAGSPKPWEMAMRRMPPSMRTMRSEIARLKALLAERIRLYTESPALSTESPRNDEAGDSQDPLDQQDPFLCDECGGQHATTRWCGQLLCNECLQEVLENDHTLPREYR